MGYLMVALGGYLLGCSSMALYISKLKKVELRDKGSKNLGASNAAVLLGWGAGITVAVHDIAKAVLAVVLARLLLPDLAYAGAVAGAACVLAAAHTALSPGPWRAPPQSPQAPFRYSLASRPSIGRR